MALLMICITAILFLSLFHSQRKVFLKILHFFQKIQSLSGEKLPPSFPIFWRTSGPLICQTPLFFSFLRCLSRCLLLSPYPPHTSGSPIPSCLSLHLCPPIGTLATSLPSLPSLTIPPPFRSDRKHSNTLLPCAEFPGFQIDSSSWRMSTLVQAFHLAFHFFKKTFQRLFW